MRHLTCDSCGSTDRVISNWAWKRVVLAASTTKVDRPLEVSMRITTTRNTDDNPMGDVDLCLSCRRAVVIAAMDIHPDGGNT